MDRNLALEFVRVTEAAGTSAAKWIGRGGKNDAISIIAAGAQNTLLHAPDTYMEKLAVGPAAKNKIDLDAPVKVTIKKVAKALGKDIREITVLTLDRERHARLIEEVRKVGARVRLITDGDVAGAISPSLPESDIDILMGIGASAEAVLAATAIKILGGEILARFKPLKEKHLDEIKKAGINNINKIYTAENLAKGKTLTFTATGVIEGPLLKGVDFQSDKIVTHSMVIRGISGTVRYITTHHHYHRIL